MTKIVEPFYDILTRTESGFESRFFSFDDFIKVLKTSFMSHEDYLQKCHNVFTDPNIRSLYVNHIGKYHDYRKFDRNTASLLSEIIKNDHRLEHTNFFRWKILNFERNNKVRFNFYVNGETGLFFQETETNSIIKHTNTGIDEGVLICRIYNYSRRRRFPEAEWFDVNLNIKKNGIYDSQNRVFPFYLDEFINNNELSLKGNQLYVISPLLQHCLRIYDKILLLSKQRDAYVHSALLKNAVDASYNDARNTIGMNLKYRRLQEHYIRVVPSLEKKINKTVIITDRFFPFIEQQQIGNTYSYADVISGGSGDSGLNKISLGDYKTALGSMGVKDIMFTKEENTSNGLYSWINQGFARVVSKYNLNCNDEFFDEETYSDSTPLDNHMFSIDYENQQYVTAAVGSLTDTDLISKKRIPMVKKINQRFKLSNGKTYMFEDDDAHDNSLILKELGTEYSFRRDFNYLPSGKEIKKVNHARNALVAFVSNDIVIPPVSKLVDMPIGDLNKWMYSLRGVACEGFFTPEFLSQRMILKRTKRLKCSINECTPEFQALIKNPEEMLNKVVPSDFRENFIYRQYINCICTGKIINGECRSCGNPRPSSPIVHDEYWVDFNKQFDFVVPTKIKIVEDGINVYLDYSVGLANVRMKDDELTKSVAVETSPKDLGYIVDLNVSDIELKNVNIPLDGVYYGLGGFKSKTHGIGFSALRLYHAMKYDVKFNASECIEKENELNDFLKTFKKSKIMTRMYNKESETYENRLVEAWIGIVSIEPTEASQEFNKARFEDERSFSKINYALNAALGFDDLNEALSAESHITNNQSTEIRDELFKIAAIHSSIKPLRDETDAQHILSDKHDGLLSKLNVTNLSGDYANDADIFSIGSFDKYSLKSYVTFEEYMKLKNEYPLFTNPKFSQGFFINCCLGLTREQSALYGSIGEVSQVVYFPPKSFLLSMFEMIGDNNVRINGLLNAYISVFESLAVSKYGNSNGDYRSNIQLLNKNDGKIFRSFNDINGKILRHTNLMLFGKEGLLNQDTNIAIPRIMSKQLTCIDCPYDVAIIGKNGDFKKIAEKVFASMYPGRVQDWTTPIYDRETRTSTEAGWCWMQEIYGFSIREPNLFSKQNLNIKQIWSSYKADAEYKERYGTSFHQKHPKTKGIYLNPVFVAFNLEGDVDGDNIYMGIPYMQRSQNAMQKVYEEIKDNKFFDSKNTNPLANLVRDTYLVPSLKYLIDEAENLNFELDTLKIGYSRIRFDESLDANFEAAENKTNVGPLTTSEWQVVAFIYFYVKNYDLLVSKGYVIPELNEKNQYELMFIFQYLLAQLNGVRAMKDDGSYGKLTFDALILNKQFNDDEPTARVLLTQLIKEYKNDNAKHNIHIDFDDSVEKLFKIMDNLFISSGRFKGFGFMMTYEGKAFKFSDKKWTYGQKSSNEYYDCTDRYDPLFIDFYASYLLLFGRDPDMFIEKFGYGKTLESLNFKKKNHLHTRFLSFIKDIFIK